LFQPLFNKSLSRAQRGRLLAWNTAMYGVPVGVMGAWFYENVQPGPLRDAIEHGVEDVLLNATLTAATGEKQDVDFSDLSPINAYGLYESLEGMWTSDLLTIVANTPSASLLFGNNPRVAELYKTTTKWVIPATNYEDPELAVKYTDVATAFGNLFSGFSNGAKAIYAMESGQFMSSLGNITDDDVTKMEAKMKLLGFRTHLESGSQQVMQRIYKGQTDAFTQSDVNLWYNELRLHLTRRGISSEDRAELEEVQRILSEGWRIWKYDEPKFRQQMERLVDQDVKNNGVNIYQKVAELAGWDRDALKETRILIGMLPHNEQADMINKQIDVMLKELEEAKDE
jgi:hypothetical protein